jgi:hypothetical protein
VYYRAVSSILGLPKRPMPPRDVKTLKVLYLEEDLRSAFCDEFKDLETLLYLSKDYYATNTKDKVYAVSGILESLSCNYPIEVDYETDVSKLYIQISEFPYDTTKTLDFLSTVEKNSLCQSQNFYLPSWAPD